MLFIRCLSVNPFCLKRFLIIATHLLLLLTIAEAQGLGNLRGRVIPVTGQTLVLDSLSVIPGSFVLKNGQGVEMDSLLYTVDYAKATLLLSTQLADQEDTLFATFRVFPMSMEQHFSKRNYEQTLSPDSLMNRYRARESSGIYDEYAEDDLLQTQGSISRGIRFGGNQGLSVNSNMNLTLSGELGSGLMVEGAISDRSIPLQPDGSTHSLEEFDHIHLRVYKNNFSLQAGDIELMSPQEGALLAFRRNVQGLAYKDRFDREDDTLSVTAALAVPKGKFSRSHLNAIEGNQGPYRLYGEGGEPYIIILSGSEKVYVDGVLLQRGEDGHYTMDYNAAELTFTYRMPITRNSRIVVEFEYSERSYARFTTFAQVNHHKGKWEWGVGLFSEQDSKNQPFDQELTPEVKEYLATIGNDQDKAFYPQADRVEFDKEKIQYEQVDTLVDGYSHTIFRYTTNDQAVVYRVYFTHVGEGNGSYIPEFGLANGRVYSWVAPVGGKSQGSYEPVRRLVTPKKSQMVESQLTYHRKSQSFITARYALSNTDLNTFSKLGNEDNLGHAFQLSFQEGFIRGERGTKFIVGGDALQTTRGFRPVERIRPVEFERDWSLNPESLTGGSERLLNLWGSVEQKQRFYTGAEAQHFSVGQWYSGNRMGASGWSKHKRISTLWQGSVVASKDTLVNSAFYKAKLGLGSSVGLIHLSVTGEMENLKAENMELLQLQSQSARWYQLKSEVSLPDTLPVRASLEHTYREDYAPNGNAMEWAYGSHQLSANLTGSGKKAGNFLVALGYRMENANLNLVEAGQNPGSALGRLEYSNRLLKGLWVVGLGYELSSGMEPGMEYYYVEVPAGQGVYTWIDYNGNGIMEPDEFEIAIFSDEARFIRINYPGTKLISIRNNVFNLTSNLNAGRIIKGKGFFAKQMARITNQTSYRSSQKNRFEDFIHYANPFIGDVNDTLVTSLTESFRNTLAYNRNSKVFGAEYIYRQGAGKTILANGFEYKTQKGHRVATWVGLGQSLTLRGEMEQLENHAVSEYFQNRDFSIEGQEGKGTLIYTSKKQHQAEGGVKYVQLENVLGVEKLESLEFFLKGDLIFSGKGSIMAQVSYVNNTFGGNNNSAVAYEMMKGLQPGKNATWEITLRQRVSKLFELELGYHGRYLGTGKVVHSGSMMARALF